MARIGRGRLQCPRPYHTLVGDISEKQKKRRFPQGGGPRALQGVPRLGVSRRPPSTPWADFSGPSTCPTSGGTGGRHIPLTIHLGT